MKNLKMYCVTNKVLNFLDNSNYNIGWVGNEISGQKLASGGSYADPWYVARKFAQ